MTAEARLRDAILSVDAAGMLDEGEPFEALLSAARDVIDERDRLDAEWRQRVGTDQPRMRLDDGRWVSVSPHVMSGTSFRLLPDASTFVFEFTETEGFDDKDARETAALLRAMADWLVARPDATPLYMTVASPSLGERCHGFLTVEGAPDEDVCP